MTAPAKTAGISSERILRPENKYSVAVVVASKRAISDRKMMPETVRRYSVRRRRREDGRSLGDVERASSNARDASVAYWSASDKYLGIG